MQGRLRGQALTVTIDSACAACGQTLSLDLSDRLEWRIKAGPDTILVFEPDIDWATFKAPTIVDDY